MDMGMPSASTGRLPCGQGNRRSTMLRSTVAFVEDRAAQVRAGIRVEVLTIAWMLVEAAVAMGAGIVARSILLTAFGVDSVIELVSGGVLLWRLCVEATGGALERVERAECRAAWITGISLTMLCAYVVATAALGLLVRNRPEASWVGIGLAVAALVVMPLLARAKRQIANRIGSAALRSDAACSITCVYMAAALLVGLLLTAVLGWWWADAVAALVFLYWLVPETREALEGAKGWATPST
jgi:divalent metal cation (Fe/Co/Zn/Cd) transporter